MCNNRYCQKRRSSVATMILRSMSVILMVLIGLFPYVRGYSLNQGGETVQFTWSSYPNERPIIGILSEEYSQGVNETFIAASYVKFVEAGGARVVNIRLDRQQKAPLGTLDSINGVLFPGGSVSITDSEYAKLGKVIFQYAKEANDKGDYFPIWGTCLGFELLASLLVPGRDLLVNCTAYELALPLNITTGATEGRLFSDLPTDVYQALLNKNVTANFHHRCLTPQMVKDSGLDEFINVLSTNYDANGLEFVSTFEVKNYPFYGVQWHPEKIPWEWTTAKRIPHSSEGVRVTQHFANFFVNEAKKSNHSYSKPSREIVELIYNVNPTYTGKNGSDFEQLYIFKFG